MRMLCIHFDNVVHVDPSGMGLVLDARRRLLEAGLTLQSTRVPARLRFLLYAWCIRPLMDELTPRTMPIVTKESQPAMNITKN
jgi:ABC-type transporter Mla MlaB component